MRIEVTCRAFALATLPLKMTPLKISLLLASPEILTNAALCFKLLQQIPNSATKDTGLIPTIGLKTYKR